MFPKLTKTAGFKNTGSLLGKTSLAFFLVFFILGGSFTYQLVLADPADPILNEVYVNGSGEWIEVLNPSDSSINLNGYKFLISTSTIFTINKDILAPARGLAIISNTDFTEGALVLDDTVDSITFLKSDGVTGLGSASYGGDNQPLAPGLDQSLNFDGVGAYTVSTQTKGWFNDAGQAGSSPLLSAVDSTLASLGIDSNIGELVNPSSTPNTEAGGALYFEKNGQGKIIFEKTLNLSDSATVAILQNLGATMEISAGHIKFDSATAAVMSATGAKIYMYGLNTLGYILTPNIITKDDAGAVLGVNDAEAVGNINYDSSTGILSFTALHFTQFDLTSADPVVDTAGPTVAKLGDDSADVVLNAGDTNIIFNETLSDNSKTAIQNALTAGADESLTYSWSGAALTVTAAATTTFTNDVTTSVSDTLGNISASLLIIDSVLAATQTVPNGVGAASVDSTKPQVVITNPTQAVDLTVNSDTVNPTIDVSSFISNGSGTIPRITITSANIGSATVAIPATTVTSADDTWNGIISAPTATAVTLPVTEGETKTLGAAIEVGFSGAKLSFTQAVRILFPNQAGKKAGYIRTGITFTEISNTCAADDQATGDALAADGDCKIDSGSDLVIWTKHFTQFATYSVASIPSQTTPPQTSESAGNNDIRGAGNTPIRILPVTLDPKKNDVNADGQVNILDFNYLMISWNKRDLDNSDFNSDGNIDVSDFNTLMVNWTSELI